MYSEITQCRICKSEQLETVLDLGEQALTGVFPKSDSEDIEKGPLQLSFCTDCGLLQLKHNYDLGMLYGDHYGYRSGLNASMVEHLRNKVAKIEKLVNLSKGDLVLDIGANDSTLLRSYTTTGLKKTGIDPSGEKFLKYYPEDVSLIPDFFSSKLVKEKYGDTKAKVVTSIAMFYDLEDPTAFMQQVAEVLDTDGVWVFEQSYMPFMLDRLAYDTVCHEHLEYYAFKQIKMMCDKAGLKVVDVEFNDVNGGSFSCTVAKKEASYPENVDLIKKILKDEEERGLSTLKPYEDFRRRTEQHRNELKRTVAQLKSEGKTVFGYGASTKGNVILQYCGFTTQDIPVIAEVNEDKFGAYTPGTKIPIVSEADAKAKNPTHFLVLPWHFKPNLVAREQDFIAKGGKMLFPLPEIHTV